MSAIRSLAGALALTSASLPSSGTAQLAGHSETTAEFDQFLAKVERARQDFVNGDPTSSAELNATRLPFALLGGAGGIVTDAAAVNRQQVTVAALYREGQVTFEYAAKVVSGDMAYTVGSERRSILIGDRREDTNLRVTQIYRREDGQWKIVLRHADPLAAYQAPTVESFRQQPPQAPSTP